jgi:hypothetical protein
MYASVSASNLKALIGSYRTYQELSVIQSAYSAYSASNAFECLKCFFAAKRKRFLSREQQLRAIQFLYEVCSRLF